MLDTNLVARIGVIATKGKHKEGFLFVGATEPNDNLGRFFYLIEIDSPWVDGEKIKKTILNSFQKFPLSDRKTSNFESIIKEINFALGEISQAGEHEWIGKLNAIIGIISGNQLIFTQTGRISGYLFRGNKISHITEKPLENDDLHPLKTFVSIIDGNISPSDKIVIANSKFYSHTPIDQLRQTLATVDYKNAIADICKKLRRSKIRDVNSLIFEISDNNPDDSTNELPEIVILDEIPDSPAVVYFKLFKKGAVIFGKSIFRGAKSLIILWNKSIQPKINSFLNSKSKNRPSSVNHFRDSSTKNSDSLKINYFNKKTKTQKSAVEVATKISSKISQFTKKMIRTENRKYLYIIALIFLLSIGFIKIQINNKNNQNVNNANQNLSDLSSARTLYSEALDDLGLGRANGKEKLIFAFDLAKNATSNPSIADESKNLLAQIQSKLDELNLATRINQNSKPTFSFSSNLTVSFVVGANIFSISDDGKITKYDTRAKTLENFGQIEEKFGKVVDAVYADNNDTLFILTQKPTVLKLDIDSKSISEPLLSTDASWEKSKAIAYYSSNIYLLGENDSKIWKHALTSETYSKGVSYVSKQPISLENAIDLAIDGNVFALKSDGVLVKISKSIEDSSFSLSGIPTPNSQISSPEKVFTDQSSNSIYVLDKSTNRVLQFAKTGNYQKQYVLDNLPLTTFTVNEKLKKLWLISESKVFELDI